MNGWMGEEDLIEGQERVIASNKRTVLLPPALHRVMLETVDGRLELACSCLWRWNLGPSSTPDAALIASRQHIVDVER